MKQLTIFLLMFMPIVAFAQNYPGMNEADMQRMMQQMEKMQSCMEKVDQNKLKQIEQRSRQMEAEMKSLCADGKRDEAQKKAISFGKEMANDPTLKTMMKCGENMKGIMPEMSFEDLVEESSDVQVCDSL